jgi:transposase-like protein
MRVDPVRPARTRHRVQARSGSRLGNQTHTDVGWRQRGKAGRSWYVGGVHLHRRYLYRATDRSGRLVDLMFCEHRDMAVAKALFESAKIWSPASKAEAVRCAGSSAGA